jgi:pilus assembly protein TadC
MSNPTVLLALWCAFVVGLIAYRLLPVQGVSRNRAAEMALAMQQAPGRQLPWYFNLAQVFRPLLRLVPSNSLTKAAQDLYWAQLAGQYLDWDATTYWCLRIGLALAGLAFGMLFLQNAVLSLALAGMAFMAPSVRLGSLAKRMRKQFLRELPEMVELLRLEVASGASVFQGINGVSSAMSETTTNKQMDVTKTVAAGAEGTGIFPRWLRRVLRLATGSNLFAPIGGAEEGILLQEARRSGMQELVSLAVQLDIIARRGSDPGPLLASVAQSVSEDYQAQMDRAAEKIGAELIFPTFLFFFVPFMIAVLLPLVPNLIAMF